MRLSTEIKIEREADISYGSRIMMFGSCFSENIGEKLSQLKFNVSNNPLGILFNPCSILQTIERIASQNPFVLEDLFCSDGVWNSFHLHSKFAQLDAESYLENANHQLVLSHEFMRNATHLFITLGTAWVYEYADNGLIVANCHKEPSERFIRKRLSEEDATQTLQKIIETVQTINPNISVTFTVSPIRHWKDGAHGNQISKATLLLAIDNILRKNPSVHYFPAYEIMMDELRDYRFYAEDLIHPNELAIEYIWEKFRDCRISDKTTEEMKEVRKIVDALNHRPFNPQSEGYQTFKSNTLANLQALKTKLPFLNFDEEVRKFLAE